jgi:hypothetical protein
MHRTFGLMLAAGLLSVWPATAARAQFSYGHDSFVYGVQPSASYYYYSGYQSIYSDPGNGVYSPNGIPAPPRAVAPYYPPPFQQFDHSSGLNTSPTLGSSPLVLAPAPPRRVVPQRRGLFGRMRGKR